MSYSPMMEAQKSTVNQLNPSLNLTLILRKIRIIVQCTLYSSVIS